MKKIVAINLSVILILLIAGGCQKTNYSSVDDIINEKLQTVQQITPEELKQKLDEGEMILLIDVRERTEHNLGYIPGAVHISRGTLEFKVNKEEFWDEQFLYPPEKTDEIIVYCKKGKRGILSADALMQLGFTNVKNLEGGWKAWEMAYPLDYMKNLEEVGHAPAEEAGGC